MAAVAYARRSSLILPVNVPRFVEKAFERGADAIVLDLEDSVPAQEKASARTLVRKSLPLAGRGGAEVLVRVNNDPALLADDVLTRPERRRLRGRQVRRGLHVDRVRRAGVRAATGLLGGAVIYALVVDRADPLHWVAQVPILAAITTTLVVTYTRLRRPNPIVVRIVVAAVVLLPFAFYVHDLAYAAFVANR